MIFVTVGTHEQPFNRLVQYIDKLVDDKVICEDVIVQLGYCTYEPRNCKWSKLYSYTDMEKFIKEARIVITHGGPASFMSALQIGKIPIVVPRQKKFGEHVNDHQAEFAQIVWERYKNIIPVYEIEELVDVISGYNEIRKSMANDIDSNNEKFNVEFEKIIDGLFR